MILTSPLNLWLAAHICVPARWRKIVVGSLLCAALYPIFYRLPAQNYKHQLETHGLLTINATPSPWSFIPDRDRYNHGLSAEQCDTAFPDLYREIDRASAVWKGRHITADSIQAPQGNDGFVQILLHQSQLRILRTQGLFRDDFRHRIHAVLQQLQRALYAAQASSQSLPDCEFTIVVDDFANPGTDHNTTLWTFTRQHGIEYQDDIWLIPDFHFFAAPPEASSFEEMQARSRAHDSPIGSKKPQVVWRGVEWTNPELRQSLLHATDGKHWADVASMSWETPTGVIPMDSFCDYAFVINTEGRSWSARMLHILNCDSVPLIHDAVWLTHYYHLFAAGENCVRVRRDFADLEEQVYYYLNNTQKAQAIVERSINTFRERYTSPAASSCYWRRLIRTWRAVAFEPDAYSASRLRGIAYEQFMCVFSEFICFARGLLMWSSLHRNDMDYPYPLDG